MKKLFITWLIWLPFSNAAAQFTIYTPNGSTVPNVTINPEMTPAEIAAANDYVDITYPNATRLADASNTYNCHAYSFYLTEGGNTNAWINAFLPTIYWDDGSYTEVTDPRCFSKVTYPVGDHSAVFAGNGQHISKWGPLPLMQHNEDYSPYNSTGLKYYNRNFSISGPNAICATVSDPYIIPALPPGTTVAWSTFPSTPVYATPTTPTAPQTTLTKYNNGITNLQAIIQYTCNTNYAFNRTKNNILVGFNTPMAGTYNPPSGSSGWMVPRPPRSFDVVNPSCIAFATNMSLPTGSSLTWSVTEDPGVIWGQVANTIWANFSAIGQRIYLSGTVTNVCGSYQLDYIFECTTLSTCGIQPQFAPDIELKLSLSPNPAKATMLVSLVERVDITKRKDVEELWITDRLGNVRFKQKYNAGQKNVSINISPLPPGIYAVVASHGKSQVSEKFIKE